MKTPRILCAAGGLLMIATSRSWCEGCRQRVEHESRSNLQEASSSGDGLTDAERVDGGRPKDDVPERTTTDRSTSLLPPVMGPRYILSSLPILDALCDLESKHDAKCHSTACRLN